MMLKLVTSSSRKQLAEFEVAPADKIADVKLNLSKINPRLYPERVSLRNDPKGKGLSDDLLVSSVDVSDGTLYVKDLGPQVGWTTVFLTEYSGPLVIYLFFYMRPSFLYGTAASMPRLHQVDVLMYCHTFHYAKRLLETLFIHRFSKGTMPIMNIFKNSGYYWGFGAWMAYFINHPLYTPASDSMFYAGLIGFGIAELGNFSIHYALRNLRPPGTKIRAIPRPTANPFTWLFGLVSCPNYTYEVAAWTCFSFASCTLTSVFFTLLGAYQMTVWALGKHKNYRREFPAYPKKRKAIFPFIL